MSPKSTAALIAAGAVLPGTTDPGQDRDTVTARHYTHPGLDDRVVVRLVPAVLGQVEDLTCEYLGFSAPGHTADVGTGRRSALGFPAWALVHDPANAHHALNLVKDIERLARVARSRAGAAKDGFTGLGALLGRSAPHLLPTFYEQAGRIFLNHGNPTYAAAMFGKAREAEEVHGLDVDPERTREVFLEFAFAGALTAKALSAHAKSLARKHDPDTAYELFFTLCVERTRGGLPPYAGLPEDLRRLAKAAKRDRAAEDERLLRAVLDSAAISRAAAAFWQSYRDALVALATRDSSVRGLLLSFVPSADYVLDTWLDILSASGAIRCLTEPVDEVIVAPAEWLSSVLAVRSSGWRTPDRSARLLELVEAMTDRLVAAGEPVHALRGWRLDELDLLDLLVASGVPIAAGEREKLQLNVSGWVSDQNPGRRDLTALAASEQFGSALGQGLVDFARSAARNATVGAEVLLSMMAVPGLRAALRHWITTQAAGVAATGLPDLTQHLERLAVVRLPEAYADVPEAAEAIAAVDVVAALHTTLRAGLLDELGWPALEEAVARLSSAAAPQGEGVVMCGEGWPALVLRRGETFVVVGPDGVLAEHVARIPADARHRWGFSPTASWFDGVLLVQWRGPDGELAYWSDAPDRVFDPGNDSPSYYALDLLLPSIALPGGARIAGRRAIHPGDSQVPGRYRTHCDGVTVWTSEREDRSWRWQEVDPATGERGRASLPRFIEDFAADGASLELEVCDLRPAVPATANSPLGTADGQHGWRVRREPDGSWLGESIDGRRVQLPSGGPRPTGVLRLPGGANLVLSALYHGSLLLFDAQGIKVGDTSTAAANPQYAAGTPFVPPTQWWHLLTPRDEAGSAALRGITRQTVDEMVTKALAELDKQPAAVRGQLSAAVAREERDEVAIAVAAALPALTHPGLLAGVVNLVRHAAKLVRSYRGYAEIATAARNVDLAACTPSGPEVSEDAVNSALGWFGRYRSYRSHGSVRTALPELIAALGESATEATPTDHELPESGSPGWFGPLPHLAALAHRAASPLTPDEQRDALVLLLRSFADSTLADSVGHWRTVGLLVPQGSPDPKNRVTPVRDGFIAVFEVQWRHDDARRFDGVQFTRVPGTFDLPSGWRVEAAEEVSAPFGRERIAQFLDVLAARGPAPWFPDAVPALVERTGLGTAEATVLLAGMPGVDSSDASYLSAAERQQIDLSSSGAKVAKEQLSALSQAFRYRLLAAAVPADPAELWTRGPDVAAVAAVWVAEYGQRSPVPDDVLADAAKLPIAGAGWYVTGVANPDRTPWLTVDSDLRLNGTDLEARQQDGFTDSTLRVVPQVLAWLAYRLPVGSPLRARLPEALALARQRVAHPGMAVDLGWAATEVCGLFGVEPPANGVVSNHHGWLDVIGADDSHCRLIVRPGLLGPQHHELLAAVEAYSYHRSVLQAVDLLADEGLTAACAVTAPEGVDPAAYHQDPTVSVPHLVVEAAGKLGLVEDAAVLYLQLLALPDPTDANAARWTGWKPARLRSARAALAESDLVLAAKRARAGRSLFLPGGWLALAAPHLPLESWKAPMFGFTTTPAGVIAPREPVADLFARAWQRVLDGDTPAYEELRTGGRR